MQLKFVNEFIIGKEYMMAIDFDSVINSVPSSARHGDYDYYLSVNYGYRPDLNRRMVLDLDLKSGDLEFLKAKMWQFLEDALNAPEPIVEIHTYYRDDKSVIETSLYRLCELNSTINIIPKSIYETPEEILCQIHLDLMKKLESPQIPRVPKSNMET